MATVKVWLLRDDVRCLRAGRGHTAVMTLCPGPWPCPGVCEVWPVVPAGSSDHAAESLRQGGALTWNQPTQTSHEKSSCSRTQVFHFIYLLPTHMFSLLMAALPSNQKTDPFTPTAVFLICFLMEFKPINWWSGSVSSDKSPSEKVIIRPGAL